MRNCFIPHFDAYCKDKISKRKMFTAPKDEKIFSQWKEILINKRPLKPTDKVCERHFKPEEILTTWDHIINGELCSVTRSKPCLKKDAVPSLNLCVELRKQKPTLKESNKRELPIRKEKPAKKQKLSEIVEDILIPDTPEIVENVNISKPEEIIVVENDNEEIENLEQFEALYDEVYEVTLPTTLWGIHRDPERKFLVFSEFNKEKLTTSKIFYIDQKSNFKMCINNVCYSEGQFTELSVECVEQQLHDFHEHQIIY